MDKPWGVLMRRYQGRRGAKGKQHVPKTQDQPQSSITIGPLCEYYFSMLAAGGNICLCLTKLQLAIWTEKLQKAGFLVDRGQIVVLRDHTQITTRSDRKQSIVCGNEVWLSAWKPGADRIQHIGPVRITGVCWSSVYRSYTPSPHNLTPLNTFDP
jgi:hypothetical protein